MGLGKIKKYKEGRDYFLSPNPHSWSLVPLFLYLEKLKILKRFDMMTKKLWHLINADEEGRKSIKIQTKILGVYKNGNYKIEGQRSISPGNWNRKRSMLLHHREVREYKEFYEFKGSYLEAVREKGKELEKGKGMFIESMQKYMD